MGNEGEKVARWAGIKRIRSDRGDVNGRGRHTELGTKDAGLSEKVVEWDKLAEWSDDEEGGHKMAWNGEDW